MCPLEWYTVNVTRTLHSISLIVLSLFTSRNVSSPTYVTALLPNTAYRDNEHLIAHHIDHQVYYPLCLARLRKRALLTCMRALAYLSSVISVERRWIFIRKHAPPFTETEPLRMQFCRFPCEKNRVQHRACVTVTARMHKRQAATAPRFHRFT